MAWHAKPSKFKNTIAKIPRKEERICNVSVGNISTSNNGIHCNGSYLAFHEEGNYGKLGVIPTSIGGRYERNDLKAIYAHGEPITDFTFLRYEPTLLSTCSREDQIKLWKLDNDNEWNNINQPIASIRTGGTECLAAHSTASNLLAASLNCVSIIDCEAEVVRLELKSGFDVDKVQCLNWSIDGKLLVALTNKGKSGLLYDPRSDNHVIDSFDAHFLNGRESRVVFVGEQYILSCGFNKGHIQEIHLRDLRNVGEVLHRKECNSSSSVIMPFFDYDTKLLFLAAKGTNRFDINELQFHDPYISNVHSEFLPNQTLGGCLMSKLELNVMQGEVDRFYQLTCSSIDPVSCIVPRRTYQVFHGDLFPDTVGREAGCTASEWFSNSNSSPPRVSFNPDGERNLPHTILCDKSESTEPLRIFPDSNDRKESLKANQYEPLKPSSAVIRENSLPDDTIHTVSRNTAEIKERNVSGEIKSMEAVKFRLTCPNISTARFSICGFRSASKYRHVRNESSGSDTIFTNLRSMSTTLPSECRNLVVSSKYAAIPLQGAAGIVLILELSNVGRLSDGVLDTLQNGMNLVDIAWDPFNDSVLACALDNSCIKIWSIPNPLTELADLSPTKTINTSVDKISLIRYNPIAADVLAVANCDGSITMWNIDNVKLKFRFIPHQNQPISTMAWSYNGSMFATCGRDCFVKIHQLKQYDMEKLVEKQLIECSRAARIVFVCDDTLLILIHFTKSTLRYLSILKCESLDLLHNVSLGVAPHLPIPCYDFDSSVLALYGKGDRTISMYEVVNSLPYLLELHSVTFPQSHLCISFHYKCLCDFRNVEFMKGWRLTNKTLESLSLRIPRVKSQYFQDDLFPPVLTLWVPLMNADEWFSGVKKERVFTDLRPADMIPVSTFIKNSSTDAPVEKTESCKSVRPNSEFYSNKRDLQKESDRISAMPSIEQIRCRLAQRISVDHTLEQDRMEGVDEEEWLIS